MNKQTVFITGSSGFIGSNLTEYLLKRGYRVIALDEKAPRGVYQEYRCTDSLDIEKKDWDLVHVRGDIRDEALLGRIFLCRVDYVVHLAALSTLQLGAENRGKTMSVNVGGTEALLRAAAEYGKLKGFLYASTDKVYGILQGQAYTEEDALSPVDSPYDSSKAEADRLVRKWSKEYGIPGVVLRFCNIYGRYDLQTTRIVPGAIRAVLEGRECILRMYRDSDGILRNFRRDFLYIDDLCETIWRVLEKLEVQGKQGILWGEAFNLGAQRCYSMDEVLRLILKLLGSSSSPKIVLSEALIEIPEQRMDYSKAAETFGFAPKTSLEEGLGKTAAWWRKYMESGSFAAKRHGDGWESNRSSTGAGNDRQKERERTG